MNIIVKKGSAIFELLSTANNSLLIWGETLLVINKILDSLDGITRLNVGGDCLSSQGLDINFHTWCLSIPESFLS